MKIRASITDVKENCGYAPTWRIDPNVVRITGDPNAALIFDTLVTFIRSNMEQGEDRRSRGKPSDLRMDDGRYVVEITYRMIEKKYSWLTYKQVRGCMETLQKSGLIVVDSYASDNTPRYTIPADVWSWAMVPSEKNVHTSAPQGRPSAPQGRPIFSNSSSLSSQEQKQCAREEGKEEEQTNPQAVEVVEQLYAHTGCPVPPSGSSRYNKYIEHLAIIAALLKEYSVDHLIWLGKRAYSRGDLKGGKGMTPTIGILPYIIRDTWYADGWRDIEETRRVELASDRLIAERMAEKEAAAAMAEEWERGREERAKQKAQIMEKLHARS